MERIAPDDTITQNIPITIVPGDGTAPLAFILAKIFDISLAFCPGIAAYCSCRKSTVFITKSGSINLKYNMANAEAISAPQMKVMMPWSHRLLKVLLCKLLRRAARSCRNTIIGIQVINPNMSSEASGIPMPGTDARKAMHNTAPRISPRSAPSLNGDLDFSILLILSRKYSELIWIICARGYGLGLKSPSWRYFSRKYASRTSRAAVNELCRFSSTRVSFSANSEAIRGFS